MKRKILLMVLCLSLTSCSKVDKLVEEHIILNDKQVEVYSDTYLYDLLTVKDVTLITENSLVDTLEVGKKSVTIKYQLDKHEYTYDLVYEVVDTTIPRTFGGVNKTVTVGSDILPCNLITYGDNYDNEVSCEVIGEYNLNEVGSYKISYLLKDDSNNTNEFNGVLNVIEKSNKTNNSSSNNTKKDLFTEIVAKYKTKNTEIGIDVSKWQGQIDFQKVKEDGATFVMIRLGYQTSSTRELVIDPYFYDNLTNAKAAGLKVGIYFYSIAINEKEAVSQANWVLDILDNEFLDLPICFDWESWSKWNSFKMSFYDINNVANKFLDTINLSGYEGMLYSSKYYLENIWENKLNYPVWLAHYTKKTSYTGDYVMWQLSNTGKIAGINGDVDINVLYK